MIEIEGRTRKWGNSLGVLIPKDVVRKEHIKEDEKIRLLILKDNRALKGTFGMLKQWKKSTQKIKDQAREELYS